MEIINYGQLDVGLIDFKKLKTEIEDLIASYPFDSKTNQISFKRRDGVAPTFYDGVGSLADFSQNKMLAYEKDFVNYHPDLESTYILEVCKKVESAIYLNVGRVRLMRLPPRRCSSVHADDNIRIHIPIKTNSEAIFQFVDTPPVNFAADGRVYWTNTLKKHFIMNGSLHEERIHLVFSTFSPNIFTQYCFIRDQRILSRTKDRLDHQFDFFNRLKSQVGVRWVPKQQNELKNDELL